MINNTVLLFQTDWSAGRSGIKYVSERILWQFLHIKAAVARGRVMHYTRLYCLLIKPVEFASRFYFISYC